MSPSELVPAGWYPDPDDPSRARWWDGEGWSRHSRALGVKSTAPPSSASPAPWSARAGEPDTEERGDQRLEPEAAPVPVRESKAARDPKPARVAKPAREPKAARPPRDPKPSRDPRPARDLRWVRAVAIIAGVLIVGAVAFQLLGTKLLTGLGTPSSSDYGVGVVAAKANDAGPVPAGAGPLVDRVAALLEIKLGVDAGSVDCGMSESLVEVGSTFPCTLLRGDGADVTGSRLSVTISQGERVSYTEIPSG